MFRSRCCKRVTSDREAYPYEGAPRTSCLGGMPGAVYAFILATAFAAGCVVWNFDKASSRGAFGPRSEEAESLFEGTAPNGSVETERERTRENSRPHVS